MIASMTPERISVLIGMLVAIVATLPRYVVNDHQGRLTLILLAFVAVATVATMAWRMLSGEARRHLPPLLGRLSIMLLLGGVAVALWQLFTAGLNGLLLLSHGATLGLLLHALSMGWQPRDARR